MSYEGELRTRATHGPSGETLITDAPLDNHGKGASFSPTDLLATSLGTCMLTVMGIAAERNGWDLAGARLRVVKHMLAQPLRRVGKLELEIALPGAFDGHARDVLEAAARACPVHESLHPEMRIDVRFQWGASRAQ